VQSFDTLTPDEQWKMSVLVRAVRGGGEDILFMARHTRKTDRSAANVPDDVLLAGLALAEEQKVELDADWV